MAAAYAKQTISRDVNRLMEMKLVKMEAAGIIANKEIILGLLPPRAMAAARR